MGPEPPKRHGVPLKPSITTKHHQHHHQTSPSSPLNLTSIPEHYQHHPPTSPASPLNMTSITIQHHQTHHQTSPMSPPNITIITIQPHQHHPITTPEHHHHHPPTSPILNITNSTALLHLVLPGGKWGVQRRGRAERASNNSPTELFPPSLWDGCECVQIRSNAGWLKFSRLAPKSCENKSNNNNNNLQ